MQTCNCSVPLEYCEEGYVVDKKGVVYCQRSRYKLQRIIFKLQCPSRNKKCTRYYNGFEDGLFRHGNSKKEDTLFCLDLLYDFLSQFVQKHACFVGSFVDSINNTYLYCPQRLYECGKVPQFCSKSYFSMVVVAFCNLVDLKYDFLCSRCKNRPRIIIGDATSVSMRLELYSGTPITAVSPDSEVIPRPSKISERRFCTESGYNTLLLQLSAFLRGESIVVYKDREIILPTILEIEWRGLINLDY